MSPPDLWRRLTKVPRDWVGWLLKPVRIRRLCSDRGSGRLLASLLRDPGKPGEGGEAEIAIRALGGRSVTIRRGSSDAAVVWETFSGKFHLPPSDLWPRTIWDLGANIGLTVAHFAVLYPEARLIGVELDDGNLELCKRNVSPWSARCELHHAAVWDTAGEVEYSVERGLEYGLRVGAGGGVRRTAPALTLNEVAEAGNGRPVDYVKMDIEGAEERLLRNATEWAALVRCINVEVHDPYSVSECVADLEKLGFAAEVQPRHWASVIGTRDGPPGA